MYKLYAVVAFNRVNTRKGSEFMNVKTITGILTVAVSFVATIISIIDDNKNND